MLMAKEKSSSGVFQPPIRPPQREVAFVFRMTKDEQKTLKERAGKDGVRIVELIRAALADYLSK
jgi:hypothetical protein